MIKLPISVEAVDVLLISGIPFAENFLSLLQIFKLRPRDFLPLNLSPMNKKTQRYAEAQTRTITLSVQAATPPVELEILQARLNDIMIRESPEGLFTAQEISAIRAALND